MKKSKSYEERIQNQFGGFCTRVLKNEATPPRTTRMAQTAITGI